MPISRSRLRRVGRLAQYVANALVALALVAVVVVIAAERRWVEPEFREPAEAFRHGTIGTELMPLPVALVLPDLFPEHFQPGGVDQGDWVEQFGFLLPEDPDEYGGLPIGFITSRYRPQSASPSPLDFVGFSCALCHTTEIRVDEQDPGRIIYGPGSGSLNLFAFLDAFQAAVLDRQDASDPGEPGEAEPPPYRLTAEAVAEAYQDKTGRQLGLAERSMIQLWLRQFRTRLGDGLPRFGEPYGGGRSREPEVTPTGPNRTEPFRTLVRRVLERPGNDMGVYTKIATIFSQDLRPKAQFDGSIADLYGRSSMAAYAAGATVENMTRPEIVHNIRRASDYSRTLRPPRFEEVFPAATLDPDRLARGRELYREHCFSCHGDRAPETGGWTNGPRHAQVVPVSEVGTDPRRVIFRHYGELVGSMHRLFPEDHPFHIPRDQLLPEPGREEDLSIRGYINAPMDGMFLRAPYLHNASVLTLAELINLKPRRDVFYRGRNFYDPADVGFASPEGPDARHYYRFDASQPGNSNAGHDYPWAYDDPERDVEALGALLEYLKTL